LRLLRPTFACPRHESGIVAWSRGAIVQNAPRLRLQGPIVRAQQWIGKFVLHCRFSRRAMGVRNDASFWCELHSLRLPRRLPRRELLAACLDALSLVHTPLLDSPRLVCSE
jgi:hypothetical protein